MQIFKTPAGEKFTLPEIVALIKSDHEYGVYVGTDSQVNRKRRKVMYVTTIVLHKKGKGGRFFLQQELVRTPNSLRERLSAEVYRTLQLCFELRDILPRNVEITVDVDLNKNPKYKSGKYVNELVGMVTAQDFKCRTKPDSWAAMCVADRFSK